jgi:hypothetical protein
MIIAVLTPGQHFGDADSPGMANSNKDIGQLF